MRHAPLVCLLAVTSLHANCAQDDAAPSKIPVLLVTGANNHDWEWSSQSLREMLEESGRFEVEVTTKPGETLADADAIAGYRAFVLDYNGPRWNEPAESNFLQAVRGGTGVVVVHAANNAFPGWDEYEKMVGLLWRKGTGHGRFHTFAVEITDRDHPLTRDMPAMVAHPDELYHELVNAQGVDQRVLATALSAKETGGTGAQEPMIIVADYGEGRVFHTPLGHVWRGQPNTHASHFDPQFRQLIARGTEWAATGEVTLPASPPNTLTAEEREAGFRMLFDGRTTTGWRGYRQEGFPDKGWVVAGGALVRSAGEGGGDIVTDEEFTDFELRFEWAVTEGANSGVIYRVAETGQQTYETGPEYQVFDDRGRSGTKTSAAALYGLVAPRRVVLAPVGEFNTGRVVVRDGRVAHWLNGVEVLQCPIVGAQWEEMIADSKFARWAGFGRQPSGRIALQDHGNPVRYRSIRIRSFPAAEPASVRKRGGEDKGGDSR